MIIQASGIVYFFLFFIIIVTLDVSDFDDVSGNIISSNYMAFCPEGKLGVKL